MKTNVTKPRRTLFFIQKYFAFRSSGRLKSPFKLLYSEKKTREKASAYLIGTDTKFGTNYTKHRVGEFERELPCSSHMVRLYNKAAADVRSVYQWSIDCDHRQRNEKRLAKTSEEKNLCPDDAK